MRLAIALLSVFALGAAEPAPVIIGLDAEFGHLASRSAQAIERGARVAIAEVNAAGGVLSGRPLQLTIRDNRSLPARAEANVRDLATVPDLVAVMGGKFSNAILPCVPVAQELGIPLLLPWSTADGIIDHGKVPSWTFRLSLKDSWVAPALLARATMRGFKRPGLMLPTTSWGRSNQAAAEIYLRTQNLTSAGIAWYPFGATTMKEPYDALGSAGADVIILVANEGEGAVLAREVAQRPQGERRPFICHWGITGGAFPTLVGPGLASLDLQVVQTYSFLGAATPARDRVLAALARDAGITAAEAIEGPIGVAHAYDLVHLLARAVTAAGSTDRHRVRDALEHLGPYDGLVRHYAQPFTTERHEALDASAIIFCHWDPTGVLRPVPMTPP